MKAHITITDNDGTVFEGEAQLALALGGRSSRNRPTKAAAKLKSALKATATKLDFAKPERAFVKQYARGLSGSRKFVLVLSYLAKGVAGKEIAFTDILKHWNKMRSRLGAFNSNYTNGAKENGWVDTSKKGVYVLTSSWKEAI